MLFNIRYRLTHRLNLFSLVVWNRNVKLFFEFHHQFDGVEAIGSQIIDKRCVLADLILAHSHLIAHDLTNTFFNGHGLSSWLPKLSTEFRRHEKGVKTGERYNRFRHKSLLIPLPVMNGTRLSKFAWSAPLFWPPCRGERATNRCCHTAPCDRCG